MYGLFFLLCLSGQPECYRFEGVVYPDEVNCHLDIEDQKLLAADYACQPVDAVALMSEVE
ncbi:hypothetical protein [Serratia liquefaciens]|uniref:hypothetical protein n=1 Tax=Serratia liquefaciens TaxID=614 RepID=UPI0021833B84|nr:hypothetical protein [Serratia liquefaciens]CAI2429974.1 Uncharacterised protein [Serratia liquefaciens]